MDILCIGHAAYDVVLSLSQFPEENKKYVLDNKTESGGGPAANAAYLLAKWGVSTGFMGQVGRDVYGNQIVEELREIGVNLHLVQLNSSHPTPYSVILVNEKNGSRTILNVRKPSIPMNNLNELTDALNPKVLLMDGHEPAASIKALEMYPKALSILDAGSVKPATLELAQKVDYLITSESFALNYCKTESLNNESAVISCLQKLQQLGNAQVVVTLGEQGLLYLYNSKVLRRPSYPLKAIDTTGAGDVFHGAFAYGLLKGFSLTENLGFSSAASALSVQQPGARTSIPDLMQVQTFLKQFSKKP